MSKVDRFFDKLDDAWNSLVVFWEIFLSLTLIVSVFGYLLWYGITQ